MISVLHSFYNDYLAGNDGNALLAAIHSIWDGDWRSAKRFLDQEVVLLNASTPDGYRTPRGGTNILSHKLKEYLLLLNYQ